MSRTTASGATGKVLSNFPDSTCQCYSWGLAILYFGNEELKQKALSRFELEKIPEPFPTLAYEADQETAMALAFFLTSLEPWQFRYLLREFQQKGWWSKETSVKDIIYEFHGFGKYLLGLSKG